MNMWRFAQLGWHQLTVNLSAQLAWMRVHSHIYVFGKIDSKRNEFTQVIIWLRSDHEHMAVHTIGPTLANMTIHQPNWPGCECKVQYLCIEWNRQQLSDQDQIPVTWQSAHFGQCQTDIANQSNWPKFVVVISVLNMHSNLPCAYLIFVR